MTCPSCSAPLPENLTTVRRIAICPTCLRSVVIEQGEEATVRLAHGDDTGKLSDAEIHTLKTIKKQARKAQQVTA